MAIQKTFFGTTKIRRVGKLAKRGLSEQPELSLQHAVVNNENTETTKTMMKNHYVMNADEQRQYSRNPELALLEPFHFLCVIIDGADQSACVLPHFVANSKDERWRSLRVILDGIAQHGRPSKSQLLKMTEEQKSRASYIIEGLHKYLIDRKDFETLPKKAVYTTGQHLQRK